VTADGEAYNKFSVFLNRQTGKRAVVVVNFEYDHAINVRISLEEAKTDFFVATPEQPQLVNFTDHVTIPPNSVVVLMEK